MYSQWLKNSKLILSIGTKKPETLYLREPNIILICCNVFLEGIPEFLDTGRKTWTLDSGRWTLDAGPWTLDSGLWTLDAGLWKLDFGRWTLDAGLWTLDAGLWMLDPGRYTQKARLWALNTLVDWFRTKSETSFWFFLFYGEYRF